MYKFSIYSKHGDRKMVIEQENETSYSFYAHLLLVFSDIDHEKKIVNVSCLHQMNDKLRSNLKQQLQSFEKSNIQVRHINSWFEEIQNGEYFYIFPETEFPTENTMYIFGCIELLNNGIPFDKLEEEMEKNFAGQKMLFSGIWNMYDIYAYSPHKKYVYGNIDKNKRVCKYCGKSLADGATFIEEAHAIPESLGNKTIISADECDSCNNLFSQTIDLDIFEYIKLFRILYGKGGKNGIQKFKFENGTEITHDGKMAIIKQISSNDTEPVDINTDSFKIPLEFTNEINFMNIYRALVKFVIAVIPNEQIQYFEKTINWLMNIKNNGKKLELPPIAAKINYQEYHDQPKLIIYTRKNDDDSLPYMYAELHIAIFIYVYIIPYSSKDKLLFVTKEAYDHFWKFNKHYSHFNDWVFNKFDIDISRKTIMNLQMNKSE